jgi:hypothetical protein
MIDDVLLAQIKRIGERGVQLAAERERLVERQRVAHQEGQKETADNMARALRTNVAVQDTCWRELTFLVEQAQRALALEDRQ